MGNDRCRWVRHRLPLMAGGELGPEDRRRLERHMIGCPDCRARLEGSENALSALRSAGRVSPIRAEASSLWPALSRQIRESRHARPRSMFLDLVQPWSSSGLWPALGLALGLGAVMTATILSRVRDDLPKVVSVPTLKSRPVDRTAPEVPSRGALPEVPTSLTQSGLRPIEPPSTLKFDYDLDHGTPVGPIGRDLQRSY